MSRSDGALALVRMWDTNGYGTEIARAKRASATNPQT